MANVLQLALMLCGLLDHGASLHVQADPVLSLHPVALPVSFGVPISQAAHPSTGIVLSAKTKTTRLLSRVYLSINIR